MTGRPTDYTDDLVDEFCSRIALGRSLRSVVQDKDMPSHTTIYKWFRLHDGFVEQYARAKSDSADSRADQIDDIGDKVLSGEYDPAAARVAIDAFKWTSGKHKPKKYGDKIQQEIVGKVDYSDVTESELDNRLKALLNATGISDQTTKG